MTRPPTIARVGLGVGPSGGSAPPARQADRSAPRTIPAMRLIVRSVSYGHTGDGRRETGNEDAGGRLPCLARGGHVRFGVGENCKEEESVKKPFRARVALVGLGPIGIEVGKALAGRPNVELLGAADPAPHKAGRPRPAVP